MRQMTKASDFYVYAHVPPGGGAPFYIGKGTMADVLSLTPEKPLLGNRCGKTAKSHSIVFTKGKTN